VTNRQENGIVTAATVATLLSCLTLVPLVDGLRWLFAVTLTVVAIAVTGVAIRPLTRAWVVVLAGQSAVALIVLTVLFVPDAAFLGVLPGPDAWSALADLLREGGSVMQDQFAPVDDTRGMQLILAGGLAGIALVVDLIAVTLNRPAVAGLPLLAVYCLPSALLPDGLPWYWFVPAALGFLALVATDAGDRVRTWGRVLGDPERARERPSGLWLWPATGGGRAAATAVTLAVVVPAMLPGLGASILPGQGFGDGGGGRFGDDVHLVNPILDLRRDLASRSSDVAFTYRTDRPAEPIRLVANELFDGTTWSPSTDLPSEENQVSRGLPNPAGLGTGITTERLRTEISIDTLDQRYLPTPYPPTKITVEGKWLYDPQTFAIIGDGVTTRGKNYTVEHLAVRPKPAELNEAPALPADQITAYTRLPDIPEEIRTLALRVAGNGTSYERIVRLQNWFRSGGGFTYSIEAPGDGGNDAGVETMVAFLESKTGYCVHFASAMAVMARALSIPARVAVGFLPGVQTGTPGEYRVTYARAHAWPEIYFEGAGWMRFEPTPAAQAGNVPSWTIPASKDVDPDAQPQPDETPQPLPKDLPNDQATSQHEGSSNPVISILEAVPWRWVGLTALIVTLLLLPRTRVSWRRRRRWARADDRIALAEVGWAELRERLSDVRVSWPASRTPRAVEALLVGEYMLETEEQAALSRLVSDIEGARYAPPWATSGRPSSAIQDDVRLVGEAVAASQPNGVRRRARWFPASALQRSAVEVTLEPARADAGTIER
jgi:transglutaminase-like putative cysteine protease